MIIKLLRYGTVTILSYVILIFLTYLAVDLLHFSPTIAYPIVLTLVYAGVYVVSSTFVFKSNDHKRQSYRYVLSVIAFWLLNVGLYTALVEKLELQYLLSVVLNILIFGPLRYFVYSKFVFNNTKRDL
ncbi:GtrA family protein [Candidatus Nomurabacteria bacterium]|nr:GtrA family protein [Candidatus Kaiserbacteria bacterium]MCB9815091.1 GtrA family protein [Candidatus Nomurabacteria bacterium]